MPAIPDKFEYNTHFKFPEKGSDFDFEVNTESFGIKRITNTIKTIGIKWPIKTSDMVELPNAKVIEDDAVTVGNNKLFETDFNTEGIDSDTVYKESSAITKFFTTPLSAIDTTIGVTNGGPHYEEHTDDEHTYVYIWLGVILGILMLVGLILTIVYVLYKRRGSHEIQAKKLDNGNKNHEEPSNSGATKGGVKGHVKTKEPPVKK